LFALFLLVLLTCHCGAPQPPQCARVPIGSRQPSADLIATARDQWNILADPAQRDAWPAATASYNQAVARLFDQLRCGHGKDENWNSRAASLGTRIAPGDPRHFDPSQVDSLFPAATVSNRGLRERRVTDGVGVPLVGWKETTPVATPRQPFLLPNGLPSSATAVLAFDGGLPEWHFVKRWRVNDLQVGRSNHPVAADWTAPNAFFWHMCELDELTIQNVLLPERFMEETGLYFLTPYDPEKIPVVMVHGLMSSPDAFKHIINDLAPQPWFREKYQVWLFNYPTGNPWLFTGIEFRRLMRQATAYARTKGHDRNLNRMVVVCHSMGGLITRSSITDPGTKLYDAHFGKPFDQLGVSPSTRELITNGLLYQPLTEPSRCVFLAVPHRGSRMATLRTTLLLENLIKLPKRLSIDLLDAATHSVLTIPEQANGNVRAPTSIRSLSPDSRSIIGLGKLPLPPRVRCHSIIGDRGRGGDPWKSSDGVVPYWSSHITPVESELIVPHHHGVPDHADTAKELERIFRLHLEEGR
jgi:hypothetical protein